jgi:hypothetical protein
MVMHVFKGREDAIAAACGFFDGGYFDALEVGPMSGNPKEKLLDEQNLGQIWDKSLKQQHPHRPLGRDRAKAREPNDGGHGAC